MHYLLVVCFYICVASAFRPLAPKGIISSMRLQSAWDPAMDKLDSSEIETGSSSSVAEKKRNALLQAENAEEIQRQAFLKRSRVLHESLLLSSISTPTRQAPIPSIPIQPKPATPQPVSPVIPSNNLSAAQGVAGQTFDFGLIIAFPVIIGTLALFFIFPLIKDQLGSSLPPVPMGPM